MTDSRSGLFVALFLFGLLLVGGAQLLLVRLPEKLARGPGWVNALTPVWPHPGVVVIAIALFLFGSVGWVLGSRLYLREAPIASISGPLRRFFPRPVSALAVAVLGAILEYYGLLRLYREPMGPSRLGLFLVSWLLILAGLAWGEGGIPLRSRARKGTGRGVLEVFLVAALTGFFFFLATFDVRNWYFSCIGDEFAFREASKVVAQGNPWRSVFSQDGVYGIVPAASTWFQAILLKLFGTGLRAWKTATVVPIVISLPLAYGLARTLYGRRVALFTLATLASAVYLLAYAHTGYPNVEPLLPTLASLLLFVVGLRNGSRALLVLSGMFAGLGWYTFYSSRAAVVILATAIVLCLEPRRWAAVGGFIAAGFLPLFLPMLAVNRGALIERMLEQSLKSNEVVANHAMLPIWNVGRSLLAFNYNTHPAPYFVSALLEPVSAALFVLGLASCVAGWRDARNRLLLAWFAIAITVTGVLSKYDSVSVSRLNYLLPVVALVAAIDLDRTLAITEALLPGRWRPSARIVLPVAVIALITASNLHRWFRVSPLEAPSSEEAVTIRILELPRCRGAKLPPLIVDVGVGGGILPALDARGTPVPEFGLYADPPRWLETADSRCVIFRSPSDPDAQRFMKAIEGRYPGKRAMEETDQSRQTKIRVYYPSGK